MTGTVLHLPADRRREPAPDPARCIHLLAMCALIREQMRETTLVGGAEARALLSALTQAGVAVVMDQPGLTTIEMMGVRARTNGSAHALLCAWIKAADKRMEGVA